MIPASQVARFQNALPFWLSLLMVPLAYLSATRGGVWVFVLPLFSWGMFSILDEITGLYEEDADLATRDDELFWYRLITLIWFPVQFGTLFWLISYVPDAAHLTWPEKFMVFFGMGIVSGTTGIVYAHELMHQRNRLERWLGDLLMASVLYGHFRTEHLLVHHRYVGTPRDAVTARYNEGFHRFFFRVLPGCAVSAFHAEKAMLARKGLPWHHRSNPFWRYWSLQALFLALALFVGGWGGLLLFCWQALVAVWQLEVVNYVEHYGLTRKHLGEGRYEHVLPRHSWNASHRASNWLLINLQRHSDHHYKPQRRFPLLQTYSEEEAPQLPYGYPVMAFLAMIPPLWRRRMNPRVRAWRRQFYPDVQDWRPYKFATNPMPR
ncbi:alkane 1-monooxygenase [Aliiruegeria sabulilitoris]|uniref:alkane 1-monooxygenase n=1 Tax=Aliiruegeria sabulilitoris TaxID=1510458 RepID=UPI00082F6B0E|nr:alkane 1-monooxygenase [Aliiruegeria sabulilitoris]NDR58568.1 alkane 1-monooxygenase [Pseudoruegeria sp. M32A2M]